MSLLQTTHPICTSLDDPLFACGGKKGTLFPTRHCERSVAIPLLTEALCLSGIATSFLLAMTLFFMLIQNPSFRRRRREDGRTSLRYQLLK
jgi:hypothetical protein